ncbi:MAG: hypothetical protein ACE5EW_05050 [Thermoplasmata archaeon]
MANREMSVIPLGYIAWLFAVTGAVIASLPQWFIVALNQPAVNAVLIGMPILAIGAILLIVAWWPERRRRYPAVLENTMTPIPDFYLEYEEP